MRNKHTQGIYLKLMLGNFLFTIITITLFIAFGLFSIMYFQYTMQGESHIKEAINLKDIDNKMLEKHKLQIDIVNENGEVINSYGKQIEKKEMYSICELVSGIEDSNENIHYKMFSVEDNNIAVIKSNSNKNIKNVDITDKRVLTIKSEKIEKVKIISLMIIFLLITIIISTYVVSKFIAKIITNPIHNMILGIEEFSKGNYSTRIAPLGNTELELIREALNDMAEKIEDNEKQRIKDEEKRDLLIADISHDLKTPITSISGYARALNDGLVQDEEKKKKYLEYIYDKCKRMNYLIDQLFSFSKIDVITYELHLIKGNIGEFFKETIIELLPDLDKKAFIYDFDLEEDLSKTYFDKDLLYRAFSNIILNAIKYNHAKTNIDFKFRKEENNYIFMIKDNGVGISKEFQHKIFDEFTRGDSSRKSDGGSGLGLSITKKIVELHRGEILLNSDKNQGCEFIITIPKMSNAQYFEYIRNVKEMKSRT